MIQSLGKALTIAAIALAMPSGMARLVSPSVQASYQDTPIWGRSPIPEPYAYVSSGRFSGPAVPESSDPDNSSPRNAACLSNSDQTMTLTIGVDGPRPYQVALYFVDWDHKGRRLAVEMFDADTLKLIAPVRIVNGFSGGVYLVYAYDRSAKFRIDKVRGDIVTLSGIFFDPKTAAE